MGSWKDDGSASDGPQTAGSPHLAISAAVAAAAAAINTRTAWDAADVFACALLLHCLKDSQGLLEWQPLAF